MCSRVVDDFVVDEEGGDDELLMQFQKNAMLNGTQCKKCENQAAVVLRVVSRPEVHYYPALAIMLYSSASPTAGVSVKHKFRSCLGKSKRMKSLEKVLIAYSGGQASAAMLQLTHDGLNEMSHKRLRFLPHVIYVDEGALLKKSSSERDDSLKLISSVIGTYDFSAFVSSLEMIMAPDDYEGFIEMPDPNNMTLLERLRDKRYEDRLHNMFDSVTSLTSKEDLLLKLRLQLLAQIARKLGCTKVFLGNSETRIAVRVLTDIALGSGRHLAQTCGFADDRCPDVTFVRPLREILAKELSIYVNSLKLQTVIQPKLSTKHNDGQSIQRLTESFVLGLQENFPATVSTIFRTGDKMGSALPKPQRTGYRAPDQDPSIENDSCILCFGNVDIPRGSLTEEQLQAKAVETEDCANPSPGKCSNECQCSVRSSDNCSTTSISLKYLCYSCSLIFKDMADSKSIPPFVLDRAARLHRREKMKSAISEFLLSIDDGDS